MRLVEGYWVYGLVPEWVLAMEQVLAHEQVLVMVQVPGKKRVLGISVR